MPDFNSIQTARLENLVRHALGVRNGGVMPSVSPELGVELPIPMLEDMLALAGYWTFGFHTVVNAVAAQNSYLSVFNGTTSQLLGIKMVVTGSLATRYVLSTVESAPPGTLAAPDTVSWRDTRRLHASFPIGPIEIRAGNAAGTPPVPGANAVFGARVAAVTRWDAPWVILDPGTGIVVWDVVVNQTLEASGEAWLRDALPDELAAG